MAKITPSGQIPHSSWKQKGRKMRVNCLSAPYNLPNTVQTLKMSILELVESEILFFSSNNFQPNSPS